jgi:pimeloyl-ACP methyl ester carboxylesterase
LTGNTRRSENRYQSFLTRPGNFGLSRSFRLSGFPGIDWALKNPKRIETLILLNTVYFPSKALVSTDYIQRFATPGLARVVSVAAARHSRDFWYEVYFDQLDQFFSSDKARDTYIKVFAHHSYDAREAFFSAANVLRGEVGVRAEKVEAMRSFPGQVRVIFGEDDKVMNVEMAKEFQDVFPNSQLHIIGDANHFVQLDQPQQVADLIAAE